MRLRTKRNLGTTDRIVRVVAGLGLLGIAGSRFVVGGWRWAVVILAVFQLVEAGAGY